MVNEIPLQPQPIIIIFFSFNVKIPFLNLIILNWYFSGIIGNSLQAVNY